MAAKPMSIKTQSSRYYTNISTKGKVRHGKFPFAISVIESPDSHVPVGMAYAYGRTDAGLAIWWLTVCDAQIPGCFVVIDGEFVQLEDSQE
jgi:hypothetical protein